MRSNAESIDGKPEDAREPVEQQAQPGGENAGFCVATRDRHGNPSAVDLMAKRDPQQRASDRMT
jgi:hypothetical protein